MGTLRDPVHAARRGAKQGSLSKLGSQAHDITNVVSRFVVCRPSTADETRVAFAEPGTTSHPVDGRRLLVTALLSETGQKVSPTRCKRSVISPSTLAPRRGIGIQ